MLPACRNPLLPEDKISLYRAQALNSLRHRNDVKGSVADRQLRQVMYGADSIYARQPSEQSISGMTRDDVVQWLQTWQRAPPSPGL